MRKSWALPVLIVGALQLGLAGCATKEDLGAYTTKEDLGAYATKNDLSALRSELMDEIRKAQESAQSSEQKAGAAVASAQQAADDARAASEKADAIFRKSLRK